MDKPLETLRDEWLELHKSGRANEAMELFWEKLFPMVRNVFKKRCSDFKNRYQALILTVGTTPQPLILTLDVIRPKRLLFVYSKSTESHMAKVIQEVDYLREHRLNYDRERVEDENPLELYDKIGRMWNQWNDEGVGRCALDNTGGKKSMVSAAAVAAYFLGIDLLYVDCDEYIEELRSPLPGTEFLTSLPNPLIALGDLKLRECKDLFNACSFEASQEMLREAKDEIRGKQALQVSTRIEILYKLVKGFGLWDKFHYEKAYGELKEASELAERYELGIDVRGLNMNLQALGALKHEQRGKNFYNIIKNNPDFALHLAVDLLCNAERRVKSGCPDDAAVRLYRCLELISQIRFAQIPGSDGEPFNTIKFEWQRVDPAADLRYSLLTNRIFGDKSPRKPSNLGLMHGHILLAAYQDPVWGKAGEEELKTFHRVVNTRNDLMLIHGKRRARTDDIDRLTEYAGKMLNNLARIMSEDFNDLLDQHTFITL